MKQSNLLFSFLFVLVSLHALPAVAVDYFPLTEGVVREYSYTTPIESGTFVTYFSGTIEVNGTTAQIMHYPGPPNDNLQQYWSETPEGDKLFHGFNVEGFEIIWTPPLLWMDMPLTLGKIWTSQSQGSGGETANVEFEVIAVGDVTVPAGTFPAVTVRWINVEEPSLQSRDFMGMRHDREAVSISMDGETQSYADVAGQLSRSTGQITEELIGFGVVAVEETTWGQVREMYR